MEGTSGVEIVKDLKRGTNDYVVKKPGYDVFLGTDMEYLLNGLGSSLVILLFWLVCIQMFASTTPQRRRIKVLTTFV